MSKLLKMKALKAELSALQEKAERLESDPEVQRTQEFLELIQETMKEYGVTTEALVSMLRPGYVLVEASSAEKPARPRRERRVKIYRNPHNGEEIRTAGGNHKVLRTWREQWGAAINDWWVYEGETQ